MSRLAALLCPGSVALVGCPGDLSRPGARPLRYLLQHGYPGRIYPVNPRHAEIAGLRAYPSLWELPERPDVVWIGVPAREVAATLAACARLKVPGALILSAGFGETDRAGRARQAELRRIAREGGVAVLGPNMLGFINCWDRVPLTYSPAGGLERLLPGALGVASQSGALGGIIVNRAVDRHVGISAMISTGNELDITVSECLEYFADDPRTQAVALVVEGIRDGLRFRQAAGRLLEAGKPLVALKLGRSRAGRRNALTHTGALAGSTVAWEAVARQLGIVEVESLEDLVEVAAYLSRERRAVRRVAVVSTSGGASILVADHLEVRGVRLPPLSRRTVDALGRLLPRYAATRDNPVDVTAGLSEDVYRRVVEALVQEPRVDAVVAVVTGAQGVERAQNLAAVARDAPRPVVVCWLGGSLTEAGVPVLDAAGVTCFRSPRVAALALAAPLRIRAARGLWRGRPRRFRAARRTWLPAPGAGILPYETAAALARSAGIPLAPERVVRTPAAAARAARRVGVPVAVKVLARELVHKTDAGAVVLGLDTAAAVRRAAARLLGRRWGTPVEGLLVQRMVKGVEVLVGVTRDPVFGPLLLLGAGGVHAELLAETAARPLPVSRREIRAMLSEVRGLRALAAVRGGPPRDVAALVRAVAAVARLAGALGDRLEALDVNPLVVGARGEGAWAVDLVVELRASGGQGHARAR